MASSSYNPNNNLDKGEYFVGLFDDVVVRKKDVSAIYIVAESDYGVTTSMKVAAMVQGKEFCLWDDSDFKDDEYRTSCHGMDVARDMWIMSNYMIFGVGEWEERWNVYLSFKE